MRIVKRLVDLMQGTIEVSSELGKGSRFTVTIPHKIADERYYEKAVLQKSEEVQMDLSGKRILLAEDNELNAEIAIPILAMTANAFEEDRKHALEAGMNGHIAKPIDAEILMKTLAEHLESCR